jgi:hypothetical protein
LGIAIVQYSLNVTSLESIDAEQDENDMLPFSLFSALLVWSLHALC